MFYRSCWKVLGGVHFRVAERYLEEYISVTPPSCWKDPFDFVSLPKRHSTQINISSWIEEMWRCIQYVSSELLKGTWRSTFQSCWKVLGGVHFINSSELLKRYSDIKIIGRIREIWIFIEYVLSDPQSLESNMEDWLVSNFTLWWDFTDLSSVNALSTFVNILQTWEVGQTSVLVHHSTTDLSSQESKLSLGLSKIIFLQAPLFFQNS